MKLSLFALLFTPLVLACAAACSSPPAEKEPERGTIDDLKRSFEETLGDLKKRLNDNVSPLADDLQQKAMQEYEKLSIIEYKVLEADRGMTAAQLQDKLGELGRERWECFAVEPGEKQLRFFCKRRPQSYLRYMGRFAPLM